MIRSVPLPPWLSLVGALLLLSLVGCSAEREPERYTPSSEAARAALDAALRAWQDGKPPGQLEGTSPPVQVVDSHRKPEQSLRSYQILGEIYGSSGPRHYEVRLHLDPPAEEYKARFIVLGTNPVWVMRQEDFDMIIHWEHPMDDDSDHNSPAENQK